MFVDWSWLLLFVSFVFDCFCLAGLFVFVCLCFVCVNVVVYVVAFCL